MNEIIRTKNSEGVALVYMKGAIDEKTGFEAAIGPVHGALIVNARGINRLNSSGVRAWLEYFRKLRANQVSLTFQECSVALIVQTSMFHGFLCGAKVDSLCIPLICSSCSTNGEKLVTTAEVLAQKCKIPLQECPNCHKVAAVFDEIPEEYFRFLTEG